MCNMPPYNNNIALFLIFNRLKKREKESISTKRWQILIKSFLLFNLVVSTDEIIVINSSSKSTGSKTILGFRSRDNGCGNIEGG